MVNAAEAYRQQRILNAPPEHLTLMLYNGCLKFIDDGRAFLEQKNYEEANNSLQKAQRIISEFRLDSSPVAPAVQLHLRQTCRGQYQERLGANRRGKGNCHRITRRLVPGNEVGSS